MTHETTENSPQSLSAPGDVRFCARCATAMTVREIAGRPRKACPSCRYVHFVETKVAVGAVVVRDDRLLLVKRAKPPERGKWCIPAGYLDAGETPEISARREVHEETGLEVRVSALVDIFSNAGGPGANLFILYEADIVGGELAAGDDAERAEFFGLDEIPEIVFASTHAAVERLRQRLLGHR